jgi:iron complex outermembrane recepter protein
VILKRNLLAMALASTGLCMAFGVSAQTAPTTATQQSSTTGTTTTSTSQTSTTGQATTNQKSQQELVKSLSTVTVSGFAGSVEKSIDYQRYADTIQNVVTAADIGGLPDQSIADALTRLPGVSAERVSGLASQVNCRGMSGNFVETTLDGREQPSTSGSNYIQFDQYPSELISQATVYKTSEASLIEGGVGCTIALQTANPLDNKKDQSLDVDARGSYNDQASNVIGADPEGYRVSVAYQGKFLDNTLGVGLGFAQMYQPYVAEQYDGLGGQVTSVNGKQAYVPEGTEVIQEGGEERRTGYLSTIVWRPNDEWQITDDTYYSKFDNTKYQYGFISQAYSNGGVSITNPGFAYNNGLPALTSGTITSAAAPSSAQFSNATVSGNDTTDSNVFSAGLNAKWNHGPWHLDMDASISHSSSNDYNLWAEAGPFNGLSNPSTATLMNQSATFANSGERIGAFSVGNPGIYTNTNDMAVTSVNVSPYIYHENYKGFRTSLQYDFENDAVFSDLQGGIYINNQNYTADRTSWVYGSNNFITGDASGGQPPLQLSSSDSSVHCWKGSFSGMPCFLAINIPGVLSAYGLHANPQLDLNPNGQSWTGVQSGSVNEKVRDAFLQADIDTTLWGHELTGNIGVRVAYTTQSSSGLEEVPEGTGVPITDGFGYTSTSFVPLNIGMSYTKWLPSTNLIYHWTDNDQTRFSISKDLSRPTLNYMLAGAGSWESGTGPSATFNVWGGYSPLLRPMTAMSYDLNYEHYFDNSSGLFTAGVFAKHLNTYIEQASYNQFDFAAAGITVPTNPATGQPYLNGSYATAYNAPGTTLRGFETSFQKTHFLPGFWTNFGFGANYAFTQSPFGTSNPNGSTTVLSAFPGLSRNVASAQIFYDDGKFSGNITDTYRSKWVSDSQLAVNAEFVYYAAENEIDLQTAYKVSKNVSVLFQILNLNNMPSRTYFGVPSNTGTIQYFGRTFYAGVNLSL